MSKSTYAKRATLQGGDQVVKFNDEGSNAAYVAPDAEGRKAIELGDGDDLAVVDSQYAKTSVKAGLGNDTVAVRNDARATVDVSENGNTKLVATSGRVTLTGYTDDNNAQIQTFDYTDVTGAVKDGPIKFGSGRMTIGDAAIVLKPDAETEGGTFVDVAGTTGEPQAIAFTHTAGGVVNASASADDYIMKGNYAEKTSDTTKSGGSTLISGSGDDTLLIGAADYADAGNGDNQIYITDENLRRTSPDGAIIALGGKGHDTVHNFHAGYDDNSDKIRVNASDIPNLKFSYDTDGLHMRLGQAQITFDGMTPTLNAEDTVESADLVESADIVESADAIEEADAQNAQTVAQREAENYVVNEIYDELTISADTATVGLGSAAFQKLILTDGTNDYNAAVAQDNQAIAVTDTDDDTDIFYGNRSGLNFSEYNGAVEVNLNNSAGYINGNAAQFYGINKLQAGAGNSTLIGAASQQNTLIAGTGNATVWGGGSSKDLLVGSADADKNGSSTFFFLAGDGKDTIANFSFTGATGDYTADMINISAQGTVTSVYTHGDDVVMQLNNSDNDYLVLEDALGKDFKLNHLTAKVGTTAVDFDGLANCYVATGTNATMNVGENLGDVEIWLEDGYYGDYLHGIVYRGDFTVINATTANGHNTLVGNDLDNVIYGGTGTNSVWGGAGTSSDTLVGGTGQNTFFFGNNNGADTVTGARDGDIVDMTTVTEAQIADTQIDADKVIINLTDGSSLEVQSNANIEYRLADGSTYKADHDSGTWTKK